MQRTWIIAVAAALVVPLAPAAFAGHGQLGDSWGVNYAFNPNGFTSFQIVDWAGVGGPEVCEGCANDSPTPDDCLDADEFGQTDWGNLHFAFPSIAQKIIHQEEETIVPGQAVEAPAELVTLCTQVRELVFGQEPGYEYASDPQQIGFGDVTSFATTFVLPIGFFDDSLVAEPLTTEARLCVMALPVSFSSDGTEQWAGFGFPNGVVTGQVSSCLDISQGFVDNDELQEGGTWDPGTINDAGFSVYDIDLYDVFGDGTTEVGFGLNALCLQASVVDANGAAAGFYEDYSYFWVDGPDNLYSLAPNWVDPGASDGGATGQDCSSIGIAL